MIIHLNFILVLASALFHPSRAEPVEVKREAWTMGTRLQVVVQSPSRARGRALSEALVREVEKADNLLSTWDPGSALSRANRSDPGVPAPLPPPLAPLLAEVLEEARHTRGAFDPGVGALVDAWDLRGGGRTPGPDALEAAKNASGFRHFVADPRSNTLRRLHPGAWLDSGAFGKGAALRSVLRRLEGAGDGGSPPVGRVLVDLGGQVLAVAPPSRPWILGVAHPRRRTRSVLRLSVHDRSVATSGTSERWVEVAGERLGHILDPRTGRPAPPWGSVTVVSADPLEADILSTALYVMGPEAGLAWAREHTTAGVLFLEFREEGLRATWNGAMEPWFLSPPPAGGELEEGNHINLNTQGVGLS